MSKNITYLIGAGASAYALPTIKEIDKRLIQFRDFLKDYIYSRKRNLVTNTLPLGADELLENLNWLIENTNNHFTIDTFARKLFAISSKHHQLRILKLVLSTFFLYEQIRVPENEIQRTSENGSQIIKQIPDKRYDNMIASLIEDEINNSNILGNIKIISWNYDSQFEYAYKKFWDIKYLHETHQQLQVIPSKWIHEKEGLKQIDISKFSLIHLNGLAGFNSIISKNSATLIDKYNSDITTLDELLYDLIVYYTENNYSLNKDEDNATQYFNYSWETKTISHPFQSHLVQNAINNAARIAEITDILVVIGYSFPLFNRSMDSLLISKMKTLRKVYIQDCNPELIKDIMINSFSLLQELTFDGYPKIEFILSKNIDQFVLPYEI
jgi:hypothetical protein